MYIWYKRSQHKRAQKTMKHVPLQINMTTSNRHIPPLDHDCVIKMMTWGMDTARGSTLTSTTQKQHFFEWCQNINWILCWILHQQYLTENAPAGTSVTAEDQLFHIKFSGKLGHSEIIQVAQTHDVLSYIHFLLHESQRYYYTHYRKLWPGKVPGRAAGLEGWLSDKTPLSS